MPRGLNVADFDSVVLNFASLYESDPVHGSGGVARHLLPPKAGFNRLWGSEGSEIIVLGDASQKIGPTFEKYRPQLETIATKLAGRKVTVVSETVAASESPAGAEAEARAATEAERKTALKEQAMADPGVQALLEVFPADIRDVEEM